MRIEGQGRFFAIFFPGLYVLCFTRPRYQVSVYRTIGPLVLLFNKNRENVLFFVCFILTTNYVGDREEKKVTHSCIFS